MTIHTLPLGLYQANCYIVESGKRCLVIDPGDEVQKITAFLAAHSLQPEAILLTHGHFDHVGAAKQLSAFAKCPIWLHEGDGWQRHPDSPLYPLGNFPSVNYCEEGEALEYDGFSVRVFYTPGHTMGSVCFGIENALFTGDTLFQNSIGRTDLEGGDMHWMMDSLKKLKALEENYTVYPGHGPATSLNREKRVNPYLAR